jgi:hypothetical protein
MIQVEVLVNTMNSGRFQVNVRRQGQNPSPVQTYMTREEAEAALRAIGIREIDIQQTLDLLPDIGPNTPMSFGLMDLEEIKLHNNGFLV